MKKKMRMFAPLFMAGVIVAGEGCTGKTPPVVHPEIIGEIPHDSTAFVQGFFYENGKLYESDGLYGRSALRVLDARNGVLLKNVALDKRFFGEGCAKTGATIIQITWHEQTALTWSFPDLAPGPMFVYGGEGWGLTGDGRALYMSNGSDTIYVRQKNFAIVRKIPVTLQGRPVKRLNELEYVKGTLYANVWYSDSIFVIHSKSGKVKRVVDCGEVVKKERPDSPESVLNGIAYDPAGDVFYITGKKWKNIFLVKIPVGSN